jgi:branched-chain amino acid transport system substrate-binding protein
MKLAIAFIALLLLAACVQTTEEPVKLGVIAPMTGPNAWIGEAIVPAIEMAIKQVNEQGGINGRELQIILEDADTAQKGSTAASKLIFQDNVDAIYAVTTPVTAATSAIAEQNKKVMYGFTSVNTFAKKNTYVFSDLRAIEDECKLISELAIKQGDLKLAFLGNDADFSTECLNVLKKHYEPTGKIVANEMKISNDPDAKTILAKIKQANPDALLLICWPPDCNMVYKQMLELNVLPRLYLPIALPLPGNKIATEGIDKSTVFKSAIGIDQNLDVENPTPEFARYIKDYNAFRGKEGAHHQDSVVASDNVHMLAVAMRKCPDLNGDCIRDRLAETDYTGYAGHVAYNGKHTASRPIRAITYKDDKWVDLEA